MIKIRKISQSSISVSCDPDDIDDLLWLLDKLTSAAKRLRGASRAQKAQQAAESPEAKEHRKARFQAISDEAYRIWSDAIENGSPPSQAIQQVKTAMNAGYEEARIYIAQGKRQDRERIRLAQLRLYCPD